MSMSIINRERVVVRGITWWDGAYTEKLLSDPSLMPTIISSPRGYVILGYINSSDDIDTIKIIGHFDGKLNCAGNIYDQNGISPTLCAAMGMGGGIVPMIVERCRNDNT